MYGGRCEEVFNVTEVTEQFLKRSNSEHDFRFPINAIVRRMKNATEDGIVTDQLKPLKNQFLIEN